MEVSDQPQPPAIYAPVKESQVLFEYEIGWAPELVWIFRIGDYSLAPAGSQILYDPVCCLIIILSVLTQFPCHML
jgi:hypothetical protein